jgi:serine/threonine-protein kinase
MALGTRVWGAGKLVLLVGALLATYVLFAAASMRVALRTREVQVPNFTNRTANEATAIAANLGLGMKVDETRRPDPKIAAGRVIAQEPAAGSTARRQRSVKIWLSAGQRSSTVPLLIGETERTAQLRLTQDGLTLSDLSEIRSPRISRPTSSSRRRRRRRPRPVPSPCW